MTWNDHNVWSGPKRVYRSSDDMQHYAVIETAETEDGWRFCTRYCTGSGGAGYAINKRDAAFASEADALAAARQELLAALADRIEGHDASRYGAGDKREAVKLLAWLGFRPPRTPVRPKALAQGSLFE